MGNFSNQAKSLQAPLLLPVRNRRYSPVPLLPGAPHLASKGMGPDSAFGWCLHIVPSDPGGGPALRSETLARENLEKNVDHINSHYFCRN